MRGEGGGSLQRDDHRSATRMGGPTFPLGRVQAVKSLAPLFTRENGGQVKKREDDKF